MTKYTAFIIIIALRLSYHPSPQSIPPFTVPHPAKLIDFKGSLQQNKIMLEWSVDENESANQFAVEKSNDGKDFHLTGLAFGSDIPGIAGYAFIEKAGKYKVSYRIKLINKDNSIGYSSVITIQPPV